MPDVTGNQPGKKGKTGKFMLQGHTAGVYGNDPSIEAKGQAGAAAKDLRP